MIGKIKQNLPLIFIVVFAAFLRLLWLNKIPIGITGDELDYTLTAKAVFLTGKDMTGNWSPLSLSTPPYEVPKAELPYLLFAPIIGITLFSLFTSRLTSVFFSVLFVFLIYLLVKKLIDKKTAFFAGLVMAVNPWSIYFGRTVYEVPTTIFFYFLALYILLITKGWKILLAFPVLFLAFFFYIGTKIIFLPFILIVGFYAWRLINQKKFTKQYLVLAFLSLLIFLYYLFSLKNQPVSNRLSDLRSPFQAEIANLVNIERHLSIQTPLTNLFSNKLTIFIKETVNIYLRVFSSDFLFLHGESSPFISFWNHGLFYYPDFFFLIIGFVALFKKNTKLWLLFTALILLSPLPAVFSKVGQSYSVRASLMFPVFVIFIGLGIQQIVNLHKNKIYSRLILPSLLLLYGLLVINFFNIYLFRYPIYNSEAFGLSQRIIAKYIQLAEKKQQKIIIIDPSNNLRSSSLFKQYLFYTNNYNQQTALNIKNLFNQNGREFKNIKITNCRDYSNPDNLTVIVESDFACINIKPDPKSLSIARLSDGGEIYKIINDDLCSQYSLGRYPQNITLSHLEIEKLPEDKFCQTFITDLNP